MIDGMNNLTVLAGPLWGFAGLAAEERGGDAGQRNKLVGERGLGGERRHLFGTGGGPAEAAAGARQGRVGNADHLGGIARRLAKESCSREMVPRNLESASFLRQSPVANHLQFSCSSTC